MFIALTLRAAERDAGPPLPGVVTGVGRTPAVPPPVPPLPVSPVNQFRELLALGAGERAEALARRPEKQREFLRQRLEEYDRLNPVERDERLNATDLYWHLQQLLRRTPSERSGLLTNAPAALQPVLARRLAVWDRLPESERATLLEHERTVRYMSRLRQVQMPPLPVTNGQPVVSGTGGFEAQVARLGSLPPAEFRQLHERWREFFEAPAPRAERALRSMSDAERAEMKAVLERFRKLNPEQRLACIDSFTRLAALPAQERVLFLRSAEHWGSLSADERATWRRLVTRLPIFPPLPTDGAAPPLPAVPAPRAQLTGTDRP